MPLESDKSGGFHFKARDELRSGAWPENFSTRVPFFKTVSNVEFTEQGVKKLQGWEELSDVDTSDEPIRGLLQVLDGTTRMVYAGNLSELYEIDEGTSASVGSGYSGTEDSTVNTSVWDTGSSTWDGGGSIWDSSVGDPTQWSMVNFGIWVLATNGIDTPQIFKGTSFVNLTGLPSTRPATTWEIFAKRGPYVLAFNSDVDSRDFYWCETDDPETWEPTASNAAGDLLIRELKTGIKAAVPIGDRIAVYGTDQMFLVNFLGAPNFFGYQPALDGIGAVSKHAVIPVGRRNFGWSQQGFFVTDGVSFQYIDDPQVRRFIQGDASLAHIGKVNGYHDEQNNQVRWYYASSTGKVDKGIIYNYNSDTWSILNIGRSASDERRLYDNAISGHENSGVQATDGTVYLENKTEDNAGTALTAFARTKALDLGDSERIKELDSIRIGTAGSSQGLQFRLGWAELENADPDPTVHAGTDPDLEVIWGNYIPVTDGYAFHNVRTAGRWLFIELYSNALNAKWEVTSLDIIGRIEGSR